jgi:hypothetical protein
MYIQCGITDFPAVDGGSIRPLQQIVPLYEKFYRVEQLPSEDVIFSAKLTNGDDYMVRRKYPRVPYGLYMVYTNDTTFTRSNISGINIESNMSSFSSTTTTIPEMYEILEKSNIMNLSSSYSQTSIFWGDQLVKQLNTEPFRSLLSEEQKSSLINYWRRIMTMNNSTSRIRLSDIDLFFCKIFGFEVTLLDSSCRNYGCKDNFRMFLNTTPKTDPLLYPVSKNSYALQRTCINQKACDLYNQITSYPFSSYSEEEQEKKLILWFNMFYNNSLIQMKRYLVDPNCNRINTGMMLWKRATTAQSLKKLKSKKTRKSVLGLGVGATNRRSTRLHTILNSSATKTRTKSMGGNKKTKKRVKRYVKNKQTNKR